MKGVGWDGMGVTLQLLWQKEVSPAKHQPKFLFSKDKKIQLQKVPKILVSSFPPRSSPILENLLPAHLGEAQKSGQQFQIDLPTSARGRFLLFHPAAHARNLPLHPLVPPQSCLCCWCQRPALSITPTDEKGSVGKWKANGQELGLDRSSSRLSNKYSSS